VIDLPDSTDFAAVIADRRFAAAVGIAHFSALARDFPVLTPPCVMYL